MKFPCRNCGEVMSVPDSEPQHTHFHFGFANLWNNLFSETGVIIVLVICGLGIPALVGIFSRDHDAEYEAIKKAIETPGIRVEITKGDGKLEWKILKDKDPEPEKKK